MSNLQELLSVAQMMMIPAEQNERGSNFQNTQRYIVEMFYNTIGVVDPQADVNDRIKVMEKFKEWCDKEGFLAAAEVCQECLQYEKESVGYLVDAYNENT